MPETFSEAQISELGSRCLWSRLLRSRLLEEVSSGFPPGDEEVEEAWAGFCKRHQIDPGAPASVPQEFLGCPPGGLKLVVEREVRIATWKRSVFGPEAPEHFERRKHSLDRVVYSLLRVKDPGLARELWFRVKEGEATFAELAPDYASGNEIYTAGIVGPVAYGAMHPALATVLQSAPVGKLLKPFAIAEWYLVARVEHQLPVEFNEAMKHQMIEELAEKWLDERTHGRPTA